MGLNPRGDCSLETDLDLFVDLCLDLVGDRVFPDLVGDKVFRDSEIEYESESEFESEFEADTVCCSAFPGVDNSSFSVLLDIRICGGIGDTPLLEFFLPLERPIIDII